MNRTIELIESSIDDIADDDGWAFLGDVGNLIVKKKPEFDPRNYGFFKTYANDEIYDRYFFTN
jgi:hypothetical protein